MNTSVKRTVTDNPTTALTTCTTSLRRFGSNGDVRPFRQFHRNKSLAEASDQVTSTNRVVQRRSRAPAATEATALAEPLAEELVTASWAGERRNTAQKDAIQTRVARPE